MQHGNPPSGGPGPGGANGRKVAKVGDVPTDAGLRVTVDGTDIGIFRVGDEVFAIANACPHAGFPLSDGVLEGHTVVCTAHGWEFDVRTGLACGAMSGAMPLPRYRVWIEGEDVWIEA